MMRKLLTTLTTGLVMMIGASCTRPAYADAKNFPAPATDLNVPDGAGDQNAVLAGGCFWCTEAVFERIPGVKDVISGYAGGDKSTATYDKVSSGQTKHAEVIQITYDPSQVTYGYLLKVFFSLAHDPTTLNRQGADVGTQYRSAIFYANDEQKDVAKAYIDQLNAAEVFNAPIVTTLEPLVEFFPAEKYHQDYARINPNQPYVAAVARPKIQKTEKYLESKKDQK